jgi:molecular chaperone GrpE
MSEDDKNPAQDAAAETEAEVTEAASDASAADVEEKEEEETSELDTLRAEALENRDRYLRAAAELDNFRKRTVKMRAETRDETLRNVLLEIGPMLDNFRRALGQQTDDVASFRQGMEIIFKQFNDILSGYGLVEIDAEGQPFDPNLHEALAQVASDEHPPGTVIQEMEKGYMLNDRVVRHARVVVSTVKAQNGASDAAAGDDGQADDDQQTDGDEQADNDGKA